MAYRPQQKTLLFGSIVGLLLLAPLSAMAAKSTYTIATTGNAANVTTPTTSGFALMGGAVDVNSAFQFLINRSGGGDVVVLCVGCTSSYNKYISRLGKVDSVETISFKSKDASFDPVVLGKITNAEALFIAGGDQTNYVNFWMDTPVEDAINGLIARNVPIGGTSAGLAILGSMVFTAGNGTITSPEALADPYNPLVDLDRNFLAIPDLSNVITDSHFVARDRMGRLVTFLSRISADGWSATPRGIGVDEGGALLIDELGNATFVGTGAAYMLSPTQSPLICVAGTPLSTGPIPTYRISAGVGSFNVRTWVGVGGTAYTVTATAGVLSSSLPGGSIY